MRFVFGFFLETLQRQRWNFHMISSTISSLVCPIVTFQEGKRLSTRPTVYYLMHCGKALYNNLLWKNWSTQCLPLMKIIGNSFTGMKERFVEVMIWQNVLWKPTGRWHFVRALNRTLEREFNRDYRYITLATAICQERRLPCPSRMIDVFSDTAVITFPANSLNRLLQSAWTDPPEPEYQHCLDLEIIQRN